MSGNGTPHLGQPPRSQASAEADLVAEQDAYYGGRPAPLSQVAATAYDEPVDPGREPVHVAGGGWRGGPIGYRDRDGVVHPTPTDNANLKITGRWLSDRLIEAAQEDEPVPGNEQVTLTARRLLRHFSATAGSGAAPVRPPEAAALLTNCGKRRLSLWATLGTAHERPGRRVESLPQP